MNKFAIFAGKRKRQKGATMIEYALLASVVAVGVLASLGTVKTGINDSFCTIKKSITNTTAC